MLLYNDVKHAPCVIKNQKDSWKKMDAKPLHAHEFMFMYRSESGRNKSLKSFLKKFPKKYIKKLEKGTFISLRKKEGEDIPFIKVECMVKNSIRLMRLFENNNLTGGTGSPVEKPVNKDKTNYKLEYKKCHNEIVKQISKLSDKELKTFAKNMVLRDKLIKRVHKKTDYPLSTIDDWFINEVLK